MSVLIGFSLWCSMSCVDAGFRGRMVGDALCIYICILVSTLVCLWVGCPSVVLKMIV